MRTRYLCLIVAPLFSLLAACGTNGSTPNLTSAQSQTPAVAPVNSQSANSAISAIGNTSVSLPEDVVSRNDALRKKADQYVHDMNNKPAKYVQKVKVAELYRDTITKKDVTGGTTENSVSGSAKAGVDKIVTAEAEAAAENKSTENYTVTQTDSERLTKAIKSLVSQNKILLDVEYEFANREKISKLTAIVDQFKEFGVDLTTNDQVLKAKTKVSENAALPVVQRIYESNGSYAIISDNWTVDATNELKLSRLHPISLLIPSSPITIIMTLPATIDDGFKASLSSSKGSTLSLTVFGVVTVPRSADNKVASVYIEPYGIY
jgi:hypothetical protein